MWKVLNVVSMSIICFSAFMIINIMLYTLSPGYKMVLDQRLSVPKNEVQESANTNGIIIEVLPTAGKESLKTSVEAEKKETKETIEEMDPQEIVNQAVASVLAAKNETDPEEEKYVVERFYYEDCGRGSGYWVTRYSDGSTEVDD